MSDAEKAAEEWAREKHKGTKVEFHSMDSNGVIVSIALPIENVHRIVRRSFLAGAAWAAPKWISVEERMPEDDQTVLVHAGEIYSCVWNSRRGVFVPNVEAVVSGYDRAIDDILVWPATSSFCQTATHWMPLPDAPKEEK